jgi:hypothetical protein
MFEKATPGYELLEKELKELETLNSTVMPSFNSFLANHNLFMTKVDYKVLRDLMTKNKKWKLVRVYDYQIARRGRKKK